MPSSADMTLRARWGTWSIRFGLAVAAVVLVADQVSKWLILDIVMQPPRTVEVTGFFNLVIAWNPGISLGMFRRA